MLCYRCCVILYNGDNLAILHSGTIEKKERFDYITFSMLGFADTSSIDIRRV